MGVDFESYEERKRLDMDIWKNERFVEWFNERPPVVQEMIKRFPPDKMYKVQGGGFPGTIHSYDEEEDGSVSMKVDIHSPLAPRRVFGLKPEHLEEWDERMFNLNSVQCGNCGAWRRIDTELIVQQCQCCGDDEYELYEEEPFGGELAESCDLPPDKEGG